MDLIELISFARAAEVNMTTSTNSTSEDDEVIYDLTSEARARSTPTQLERPCSRSIGIQTTLMKKSCTKSHRNNHGRLSRQNSSDSTIDHLYDSSY